MSFKRFLLALLISVVVGCTHTKVPIADKAVVPHQLTVAWRQMLARHTDENLSLSPLIISDQYILIRNRENYLQGIRAADGRTQWQFKLPITPEMGLVYRHGMVFVSGKGTLLALHPKTGQEIWRRELMTELTSPPVVTKSQKILVKTIDGTLQMLSAANGKLVWQYQQAVPTIVARHQSKPTLAPGKVICGFADGNVVALDKFTGKKLWDQSLGIPMGVDEISSMVDISADPIVVGEVLYAVSTQGQLQAISLTNGETLWRYRVSSANALMADDHALYLTDIEGELWSFNLTDGSVLWRQAKLKGHKLTTPIRYRQRILVADETGQLSVFNAEDGQNILQKRLDKYGFSEIPQIVANKLLLVTKEAWLLAVNLPEGL